MLFDEGQDVGLLESHHRPLPLLPGAWAGDPHRRQLPPVRELIDQGQTATEDFADILSVEQFHG